MPTIKDNIRLRSSGAGLRGRPGLEGEVLGRGQEGIRRGRI
jgi:hypothetical protein